MTGKERASMTPCSVAVNRLPVSVSRTSKYPRIESTAFLVRSGMLI